MFDYSKHQFTSPTFRSVVTAAVTFFLTTPVEALPPSASFFGTGVYAIYYTGTYEPYSGIPNLTSNECILPIYIGKAVPKGWRTGREPGGEKSAVLIHRLREHARSIELTNDLLLPDFRCRLVILQGIEADLISTVESALIRRYRPLWNTVVDGFGNHDPGRGRYNQALSEWDALHPGRSWVSRLTGTKPDRRVILEKSNAMFLLHNFRNSTTAS
ncbi:MAG: Eco29kI family restriction endonuclease [Chloroflexaceae bacterium]|nr:Eco29kI family restriction endonuclease [Chloroflexaceae bacterium]